jgi:oligosaccharyltransferase complex subunit beta
LTPNLIVDFVNAGSNVLLALSSTVGVPIAVNNLLAELDVTLASEKNSLVVDHFQHDARSAAEDHDVLVLNTPDFTGKNVKNFFAGKSASGGWIALPRAVGQVLGNESPLLQSIIKAPSTSYIRNPKEEADSNEEPFATGAQISLVTAFQARNSARFTILGSAEALEDKWLEAKLEVQLPGKGQKSVIPENKLFAEQVSAWTFKEAGVLKVGQIRHYLNEGVQKGLKNASGVPAVDVNPEIYRIKNDVHYEIELSEWVTDRWAPFAVPAGDALQLEFSMLSPFHRLDLIKQADTASSTVYAVDFKLPDQHGIFNFFVEYRRPFYTVVEEKNTVSVRHFAHDEWPRSFVISGAWPWIGGIWVTITGWILFVALWLYSKPAAEKNLKRL